MNVITGRYLRRDQSGVGSAFSSDLCDFCDLLESFVCSHLEVWDPKEKGYSPFTYAKIAQQGCVLNQPSRLFRHLEIAMIKDVHAILIEVGSNADFDRAVHGDNRAEHALECCADEVTRFSYDAKAFG